MLVVVVVAVGLIIGRGGLYEIHIKSAVVTRCHRQHWDAGEGRKSLGELEMNNERYLQIAIENEAELDGSWVEIKRANFLATCAAIEKEVREEIAAIADAERLRIANLYQEKIDNGTSNMDGNNDWSKLEGAVCVEAWFCANKWYFKKYLGAGAKVEFMPELNGYDNLNVHLAYTAWQAALATDEEASVVDEALTTPPSNWLERKLLDARIDEAVKWADYFETAPIVDAFKTRDIFLQHAYELRNLTVAPTTTKEKP